MYRNLLEIVREYLSGIGDYRAIVLGGLAALAVAALLQLLPPWRRSVREARAGRGVGAVLLALADGLMVLLLGSVLLAALGAGLLHQWREFSRRQGSVTEKNLYTVQSVWGAAHEQKELSVNHFITKDVTVLVFPEGREIVEEEGAASELPKGENAPTRIRRKVRQQVQQNSIISGQVRIAVQVRYIQLGSAYYTGYEDTWTLEYLVKNRSDKATEAEFRFPMPAQRGDYRDFKIEVDGRDWRENLVLRDGAQTWTMPMAPGQEVRVAVHYASTGTGHVRYSPAYMASRDRYNVVLALHPDVDQGPKRILWEDLTPLVGGMKPTNREALLKWRPDKDGEPITLKWDLVSSVTTSDMGVVLPAMTQPGTYAGRLLHEAPWGLALMVAVLVITWMLLGREEYLLSLGVLAVSYFLFYTLTAYLSEHLTSFAACFVLALLASLAVSGAYVWLGWGRRYVSHQTMALVAVFTVYYPLAVIAGDASDLLVQVLYWGLAAYAAMLAVAMVWRRRVVGERAE
jgi:hypothetical protein